MEPYENDHSTVRIIATAKGNQIEVKVVAQPAPEDKDVAKIVRDLGAFLRGEEEARIPKDAADRITSYIKRLRAAVPDVKAAATLANELHLQMAAQHEIDGGEITYDPDKKLMESWVEMEHAKIGAIIQDGIADDPPDA